MFDSMARWLRKVAKEQSDSNSIEVATVPAKIMVVDLLLLVLMILLWVGNSCSSSATCRAVRRLKITIIIVGLLIVSLQETCRICCCGRELGL